MAEPHNIVWCMGWAPNGDYSSIYEAASSDFTHVILASFHINDQAANCLFRISTGTTTIFHSINYQVYLSALNGGTFPEDLAAESAPYFAAKGITLSDDLAVTAGAATNTWTLTDNGNGGATYAIQVDTTWLSFNGSPIYNTDSYQEYLPALNTGTFPSSLRQASSAAFLQANMYLSEVVTVTPGSDGTSWRLTDLTNQFNYLIWIKPGTGLIISNSFGVFDAKLAQFWQAVAALKAANKTVLVSIGGGSNENDWVNMGKNVPQAVTQFADLLATYDLDGIDLDYEGPGGSHDKDTLKSFIGAYHQSIPSVTLTMSPYSSTISTLLDVWSTAGQGSISWINAQNYAGGDNYPFASSYVTGVAKKFGISDSAAAALVAPGWNAGFWDLTQITQQVTAAQTAYPTIGGAFTFTLLNVPDVATWAATINAALSPD